MNIDTACNHQQRAIREVKDIFSSARHYHPTHTEMLAKLTEVRDSIAHCPRWLQSAVEATWHTLSETLYRNDLLYCYVDPETNEVIPAKALRGDRLHKCVQENWASSHFWLQHGRSVWSDDRKQVTVTSTLTDRPYGELCGVADNKPKPKQIAAVLRSYKNEVEYTDVPVMIDADHDFSKGSQQDTIPFAVGSNQCVIRKEDADADRR